MKRREMAIYHRPGYEIVAGKGRNFTLPDKVRVVARAEGYAMVRHKGAMPFVVRERDLESLTEKNNAPEDGSGGASGLRPDGQH